MLQHGRTEHDIERAVTDHTRFVDAGIDEFGFWVTPHGNSSSSLGEIERPIIEAPVDQFRCVPSSSRCNP